MSQSTNLEYEKQLALYQRDVYASLYDNLVRLVNNAHEMLSYNPLIKIFLLSGFSRQETLVRGDHLEVGAWCTSATGTLQCCATEPIISTDNSLTLAFRTAVPNQQLLFFVGRECRASFTGSDSNEEGEVSFEYRFGEIISVWAPGFRRPSIDTDKRRFHWWFRGV